MGAIAAAFSVNATSDYASQSRLRIASDAEDTLMRMVKREKESESMR
jgi:hypothetical protein